MDDVEYGMGAQPEPDDGDAGAAVSVAPAPTLRAEFGAHLETNYPRLVAQLCMITLNPAEAQDLVQEAYARAWQRWADVRELHDPTGWVRQAAVRASDRRGRRLLARLGLGRNRSTGSPSDDPQHEGLLSALRRLPAQQRRVLVLVDVAHLPLGEVADIESIDISAVESRLAQARRDVDGHLSGYVASQAASQPPSVNWEDM